MQNRMQWLLTASLLLLLAPLHAAEVSVAFVNTQRVLEQAPQAASARDKLQREFAPRDSELVSAGKQLKGLEERLSRDSSIMSDSERRKLEREILSLQRELKRDREAFTEDLNIRRNEEFAKLQRDVAAAIVALAKENRYDLIFEAGVVYASDRVDITEMVLQRLNRK